MPSPRAIAPRVARAARPERSSTRDTRRRASFPPLPLAGEGWVRAVGVERSRFVEAALSRDFPHARPLPQRERGFGSLLGCERGNSLAFSGARERIQASTLRRQRHRATDTMMPNLAAAA